MLSFRMVAATGLPLWPGTLFRMVCTLLPRRSKLTAPVAILLVITAPVASLVVVMAPSRIFSWVTAPLSMWRARMAPTASLSVPML